MYRQSPGRSHRSKKLKMKHVLQISVLLGACFWLLYQVKHSHDKNIEFEKGGRKDEEVPRFGRKDIQDPVEKMVSKNDESAVEDEDVDEDKLEENDLRLKRVEETEDEVEDPVNESDENEVEESESDDIHGHIIEDADPEDDNLSNFEAREEHYKADDASSAVTHDSHTEEATETEIENENEPIESESNISTRKDLEMVNGEMGGERQQQQQQQPTMTIGDTLDSSSPPNSTRSGAMALKIQEDPSTDVNISHSDTNSTSSAELKSEDMSIKLVKNGNSNGGEAEI